jgi:TolB-like protein/DNA-binding winged helix-turn-helix (wHTH) protein
MILRFGDYELDDQSCELRSAGSPIHLEPKAFDLLLHLARNRDRLVTKQELLDSLWPESTVGEGSLTRAVNVARTAVADTGKDQRVIQTLSGRGYRFVAPLNEQPATNRRRRVALAAAASLALLVIGIWASWPRPLGLVFTLAGLQAPPTRPALPERPSLVVLPFADLGSVSRDGLVADGLTDDLTFEIARFPDLFVISRSSAFAYRSAVGRVSEIADELGVRYVVEGSVRTDATRIIVSAQLTDAASELQIWSGRRESPLADLYELQQLLAHDIAGALGAAIRTSELRGALRVAERDQSAHQLLVRARDAWYRFTREGHAEAEVLVRRALEIDPEDARLHGLLSTTLVASGAMGWDLDPALVEEGRRHAQRAVELDPSLSTAYASLAGAELFGGDVRAAVQAADRAVELGPNSDMCHGIRAMSLAQEGRVFAAIDALNQAIRLNPKHPAPYWMLLGYMYDRGGRREDALAIWERVRAANPDMILPRLELAQAREAAGRHEDAQELVIEIQAANPAFDVAQALLLSPGAEPALLVSAGLPGG